MVTFYYLMVNLALVRELPHVVSALLADRLKFAACSTEELLNASDTLSLFFSKVRNLRLS
jgi:hypothetical protein